MWLFETWTYTPFSICSRARPHLDPDEKSQHRDACHSRRGNGLGIGSSIGNRKPYLAAGY